MPPRERTTAAEDAAVRLVPLVGPLHLAYPAWNVVSVRDLLEELEPREVATTALAAGDLDDPLWRDTPELALPHTVEPWTRRRGLRLRTVGEPSPDPAATRDFARYAAGYPAVRAAWREAEQLEAPLRELLAKPLGLDRIAAEALPLVAAPQQARERAFGDGPATDWLRRRTAAMADRIVALASAAEGVVAVLASLDHLPLLIEALEGRLDPSIPDAPAPTPAARRRSLLDVAMRGDVAEPAQLLRQLRELDVVEARYHEANLLLQNGHLPEALERLEEASREDFAEPYWLPGYLLSRLGQLYDVTGRRDAAVRAYRGVRALSYAPPEARAAAERGLEAPFAFGPEPT